MTRGPDWVEGRPGLRDRALSASEFAVAAAGRRPVVIERALDLIREDELPQDWLATTVDCYSTESCYYELAQYGHTEPLKARVNEFAADSLALSSAGAVLDVGVGDGHRLARICSLVSQRCGRTPQMYGIELSDQMIERARQRGVHTIKRDMRDGFPDLGRELDGIVFLSGDLGYLMDPQAGPDLRSRILDSAHEHLGVGGRVVLELVSRDPRTSAHGADVFHFSRVPIVRDEDGTDLFHGPETWQYIKTFSKPEVVALIEGSRFDLAASSLRYIVRDSSDVGRIGHFADENAITTDESYRLLVSLVK
jgi:SAM-dependent methyltransferase